MSELILGFVGVDGPLFLGIDRSMP
eukprot:SAG25_NODE_1539_length_2824_cov_22.253211_4_plen_24_part_01